MVAPSSFFSLKTTTQMKRTLLTACLVIFGAFTFAQSSPITYLSDYRVSAQNGKIAYRLTEPARIVIHSTSCIGIEKLLLRTYLFSICYFC